MARVRLINAENPKRAITQTYRPMILRLAQSGVTASVIGRELGLPESTVRNALQALRAAGHDIPKVRGKKFPVVIKLQQVLPPRSVLIDRTTQWGNHFIIGKHGTREEVLKKYDEWLTGQLKRPSFVEDLKQLSRADFLVCHCKPLPCHGDLLVRAMCRTFLRRETSGKAA